MAGSTTANKNRCIEMTKKTTTAGGAATKGGATSKRASAGGSARPPATATNKSTRVRGGSNTPLVDKIYTYINQSLNNAKKYTDEKITELEKRVKELENKEKNIRVEELAQKNKFVVRHQTNVPDGYYGNFIRHE